MVFIQSQEYVDSFGKKSKNIIDLGGQTDYKVALNPDTNMHDVSICMGDYEKYLYSCHSEEDCTRVFKNILIQHGNKAQTELLDVNQFMIDEVDNEADLEDLEDMIGEVLDFMGYNGLHEAWKNKIEEMIAQQEVTIYIGEDETPQQLPLQLTTEQCQPTTQHTALSTTQHTKYRHYV